MSQDTCLDWVPFDVLQRGEMLLWICLLGKNAGCHMCIEENSFRMQAGIFDGN